MRGNPLKIETQPRDDCQLTVQVEVEPERFEAALKRAARAASERVKIPGFRPGKAPYAMVVQHVGEDVLREEALDSLIDEIYPAVIKELDLHPSYPGALTDVKEEEPLQLTFVVPLQPQIFLGDYRAVRVPYDWTPPSEETVNEFLKGIQIQKGKPRVVTEDRPVQPGDLVVLKITFRQANAALEEPPLLEGNPIVLVGEDDPNPDEMPFPGFSTQLIGLRKGEHKAILHHYPEDMQDDTVRGRDVIHDVEIQEIVVLDLPELDDKFAQEVSPFETMEALRESLAEALRHRSKDHYDLEYSLQVIDEIRKGATITYPPQMLEEQVESLLEGLKADLAEDGQDLDTYLKSKEMTLEEFIEKEVRPRAQTTLERELIMEEIGKKEKVKVAQADIESIMHGVLHEWLEAKQQSSGKKRLKPSAKEREAMIAFSIHQAWRKAVRDRLVAIGRGEAPELTEENKTAASAPAGESASESEVEKAAELSVASAPDASTG